MKNISTNFVVFASLVLTACAASEGDVSLTFSGLPQDASSPPPPPCGYTSPTPGDAGSFFEAGPDVAQAMTDAGDDVAIVDAAVDATPTFIDAGRLAPLRHAIRATSNSAHASIASQGFGVGVGDYTLEFWVKPHGDFPGCADGIAVVQMNENYGVNGFTCRLGTDPWVIACTTYDGSTGMAGVRTSSLTVGVWHHVALVRSAGIARLFTDGFMTEAASDNTSFITTSNVSLGRPGGYPTQCAAPVSLSSFRFSSAARYPGVVSFTPQATWPIDSSTVAQFLTNQGLVGGNIIDEAGADNNIIGVTGWTVESP